MTALTREIMTLQAEGSYAKAKALIDELGVVRPAVQKVLDRLAQVPVDIAPAFPDVDRDTALIRAVEHIVDPRPERGGLVRLGLGI